MMDDRDLIERAHEHATDWNGQQMPDLEPAKGDPTAGFMRAMADRLQALSAEVERLKEALKPFAATGEVCEITLNVQHFRNATQALKGASNG